MVGVEGNKKAYRILAGESLGSRTKEKMEETSWKT
jgi:hypothetical protein